jgi:hypothetical protein
MPIKIIIVIFFLINFSHTFSPSLKSVGTHLKIFKDFRYSFFKKSLLPSTVHVCGSDGAARVTHINVIMQNQKSKTVSENKQKAVVHEEPKRNGKSKSENDDKIKSKAWTESERLTLH